MDKTWIILAVALVVIVCVAAVLLRRPKRKRRPAPAPIVVDAANAEIARQVLEAVGGKENVTEVAGCATRLRLKVLDNTVIDKKALRAAGATAVICPDAKSVQVVLGTKAPIVCEGMKKLLRAAAA